MTKHDRFQIEGQCYGQVTDELEKSVDVYRKWASSYPREYLPHAFLAFYFRLQGEYQNAIDEARESIRLNPNDYHPVVNLMFAEMAMERPEEAKAAYEEARSHNVDAVLLRNARYHLAFLQRDEASMQEQLTWAAGKPGTETLLMAQYSLKLTTAALQGAVSLPGALWTPSSRTTFKTRLYCGLPVKLSTRRKSAILTGRTNYYALSPTLMWTPLQSAEEAMALARANRPTQAGHLAAHLDHQFPLNTALIVTAFRRSELRLHSLGAIQAEPSRHWIRPIDCDYSSWFYPGMYPVYLRGLAYLQLAEPEKAQTEFQKIIDHPGIVGSA